ncbi:hypothetical protein FVE85_1080 [Porphyridium purpureum]|uniref:Uncharacterized protein n=1 Tax=Porphyridium purpureum TaxID=35688 RepID=A0A5J4Z0H2_PORPP|nr:hypothetical protein FVE85_1080 [Porphyridium purpureum]|eukprot:POR4469..scf208_2
MERVDVDAQALVFEHVIPRLCLPRARRASRQRLDDVRHALRAPRGCTRCASMGAQWDDPEKWWCYWRMRMRDGPHNRWADPDSEDFAFRPKMPVECSALIRGALAMKEEGTQHDQSERAGAETALAQTPSQEAAWAEFLHACKLSQTLGPYVASAEDSRLIMYGNETDSAWNACCFSVDERFVQFWQTNRECNAKAVAIMFLEALGAHPELVKRTCVHRKAVDIPDFEGHEVEYFETRRIHMLFGYAHERVLAFLGGGFLIISAGSEALNPVPLFVVNLRAEEQLVVGFMSHLYHT